MIQFLPALSRLINAETADEVAPEVREAIYRETVWVEREHLAPAKNVERLAVFEAKRALFRCGLPGWMGPVVKARALAPVRRRRHRKKKTNIIEFKDRRLA